MSAFEDNLKALYAAAPEPPTDEGFTDAVARRVRQGERARAFAVQASYAACVLAAIGVITVCAEVLQRLLPQTWFKPAVFSAAISAPAHVAAGPALMPILPMLVTMGIVLVGVAAAAFSYLRIRE